MTEPKKSNTWSVEERREIVREFHESGQTQRAFCRQWGITPNTLRSWCRRFGDGRSGVETASAEREPARLLPVQVQTDEHVPDEAGIRLVTSCGLRIEVEAGFDGATLQRLLATVGAVR